MQKKTPQPRIPTARQQAQGLLNCVLGEKRTLDEAVAKQPLVGAENDQRFAMLLALTVLRHLGQLDAVIGSYLEKPLPAKRVSIINAMRLGAAQLLLLDTPPHAAVNETVALVKNSKDAGLTGLVNAVLQKLSREKPALGSPVANIPAWLRTQWTADHGEAAVEAIAQAAAHRPPLDVNSETDMENATRLDSTMQRYDAAHVPVEHLAGYADGAFFVQDLAASYPVRLLGEVHEHQVLDICAAPGGKAMQLIGKGAFVTAIDKSASRMRTVKANLKRMGMQANTLTADALEWQPSRAFDAVLLDAPCTATGTWRRHPEVVHTLSVEEIDEMVTLQRALLNRAWTWVKPGGKLVYCVCSLQPEEGEAQAAWFTAQHTNATVAAIPADSEIPAECIKGNYLRTLPSHLADKGGMDGFFAVCFQKS